MLDQPVKNFACPLGKGIFFQPVPGFSSHGKTFGDRDHDQPGNGAVEYSV
jgi:hypothetical protein